MRRKSNKTVNLTKINIAHREACAKHPKFCDEFTAFDMTQAIEGEMVSKLANSVGPYQADMILQEEIWEATVAYLNGDKKHCLQELAQCGAVILRMMQFVQDEMEEA
jgi:hypothetical protein